MVVRRSHNRHILTLETPVSRKKIMMNKGHDLNSSCMRSFGAQVIYADKLQVSGSQAHFHQPGRMLNIVTGLYFPWNMAHLTS